MRLFSSLLLLLIAGTALFQCAPLDESFGGFEPVEIRRLLSDGSVKSWQRMTRTENGESVMLENCASDDKLIFVYQGGDNDTAIWHPDSLYCDGDVDTIRVDSIQTDSGWVQLEDSIYYNYPLQSWVWSVPEVTGIRQITTDTLYFIQGTDSSLRKLTTITSQRMAWQYWEVDTLGDSTNIEEWFEVSDFAWPQEIVGEGEGG